MSRLISALIAKQAPFFCQDTQDAISHIRAFNHSRYDPNRPCGAISSAVGLDNVRNKKRIITIQHRDRVVAWIPAPPLHFIRLHLIVRLETIRNVVGVNWDRLVLPRVARSRPRSLYRVVFVRQFARFAVVFVHMTT